MTVTEVNQLAKRVVDEYRFDIAVRFLQSPTTPIGQAVWILYKISKLCQTDQASVVSHLISEFVPEATSPNAVRSLRRYEFQMYRRLGLRHGVEKCLRRYISLSSEGRELLKSLGRNGRLLDG
jgi:hypothetical protein